MQLTADDARIVAFITEASPVRRILTHIGEPAEPPPIAIPRPCHRWREPLTVRETFRKR
jgi:hypothetical protein